MPHISIKMLKGRSPELKKKAADAVKNALCESLGVKETSVSVTVEDFTAEEWQGVFKAEITDKPDDVVIIAPQYAPKDLL